MIFIIYNYSLGEKEKNSKRLTWYPLGWGSPSLWKVWFQSPPQWMFSYFTQNGMTGQERVKVCNIMPNRPMVFIRWETRLHVQSDHKGIWTRVYWKKVRYLQSLGTSRLHRGFKQLHFGLSTWVVVRHLWMPHCESAVGAQECFIMISLLHLLTGFCREWHPAIFYKLTWLPNCIK